MLETFTVKNWDDLNDQATNFGQSAGFQSWDYEGYEEDPNGETVGDIRVTFYSDYKGFFIC